MKCLSRIVAPAVTAMLLCSTACQTLPSPAARYMKSEPPRYEISCRAAEACHESVALLVGLSAPIEPIRCTAALIGSRTAITAGHCVALEASRGGACDGVWLGFAGRDGRPPEWLGCERIETVSAHTDTLLAPDYAVLTLSRETARPSIPLGESEVAPGEVVRMISVTADRFYDDFHEVRSRRCIVDEGLRLSPWTEVPPASIRVLSSCPIRQGSSGAPVLDREGRLRGLVHAAGPPYFAFGLMTLLPHPIERDDG